MASGHGSDIGWVAHERANSGGRRAYLTRGPMAFAALLSLFATTIIMVFLGLLSPTPARAQTPALETALARFVADSFDETATAIAEIAASGDERAEAILAALGSARLLLVPSSRAVLIDEGNGRLVDARTGAAIAAAPADATPVRVNNRLRRLIDSVMGSLTLASPVVQTRLAAAEAIFKARNAEALPALIAAIARESDSRVRRAMQEARAAINLTRPDAADAERFEAIDLLAARGDQDAIAVLRAAALEGSLRAAADRAIDRIEGHLAYIAKVQMVWQGLSLGSVLLLAAIGLAITFGVMGVINMAHGEMVMLGAYTTFVVQELFRAHAPGLFDLSLPAAIPLAFLVAALVGIAIERGIIRHLYGRPLETLLATWGVSLILQQTVRTVFGPTNREVGAPSYMQGAFDLFGLAITWNRLWIILFTLAVFALLLVILKLTPLGLQMRAVTQNRRMAAAMGIRTPWIDAMTFALGSGIAGIAGVALSQIDNVSPNLGQSYIIDSFLVVVFGGVGNLWGTLVSAFTLGIANKFLEPFAGAVLAKILILVAIILFIQKRPRGLFALKGRAVEQ